MTATYRGVYPMLFAFFDHQNRLDREAMAKQVEFCIEQGAHGIAVLGLVTEAHKMTQKERLDLMRWVAECIAGRLPYAVTVVESTIADQIRFAQEAARAGANWVILQPPPPAATAVRSAATLLEFFVEVASALEMDVGIQNNSINFDVFLSPAQLLELQYRAPNVCLLKAEGFSAEIAALIDAGEGAWQVFGGHGGIELMSLLRSGGVGLIPAPNFIRAQVRVFSLWEEGSAAARAQAEAIHRQLLPTIVFMSRSIAGMLCYGKRLFCRQAGLDVGHERAPALAPTAFGLEELALFEHDLRIVRNL